MKHLLTRVMVVIAVVVLLAGTMSTESVTASTRTTFTVSGRLYEFETFNPFGCWPETHITVAGDEEYVDICPVAATPTPSQTPTPTSTPTPFCTPVVCYLVRELPDHACTDDEITVNLSMFGHTSCYVVSVEETVPDGWEILAPPWHDQIGNTYIWNESIESYTVRVGGPFLAEFSGTALIWDPCDIYHTKLIEGDATIWIPLDEVSWLSRTLPETGFPGEHFTVTLSQQGGPANIIQTSETLPTGWMVTEPADFEQQDSTFTWNRRVLEYTVLVPPETEPGDYDFSGATLSSYTCPTEPFEHTVVGDNQITIIVTDPTPTPTPTQTPPPPTCTPVICYLMRELSDHACTDDEITVNLSMFGHSTCYVVSIEETVPDGWEVLAPPWDDQIGNTWIWNESIDSYIVSVGGPFLAEFSGSAVIWDPCQGNQTKVIEGDNTIWIPIDEISWLSRMLPESGFPGEHFTVTLSQQGGPAAIIQTSETLPTGWMVTEPADFEQQDNTFTWSRNVSEYTILVPSETEPGNYVFSGTTLSSYTCPTEPFEHAIVGDSQITIVIPEPTPTPAPPCPDPVCLEFQMPDTMYGPGSVFYLDLLVINTGDYAENAMVFVALNVGTDDFWFYPGWVHFPQEIDWETTDIPDALHDIWTILPEFSWPHGAGEFYGAMFLGAVMHEGELISNLATITFGWTTNP